jgi:hypothetical protein
MQAAEQLTRAGQRGRKRLPGILALVFLGFSAGGVAAETWFRIFPPKPQTQIIRSRDQRGGRVLEGPLRTERGVARWEYSFDRQHRECARDPDRIRILFLGDSITYGVGIESDQVFSSLLEKRLNEDYPHPGFCVLNYAQPSNGFEEDAITAEDVIPQLKPALVLWGLWEESRHFVVLGDTAYDLGHFDAGGKGYAYNLDGYPVTQATRLLPAALNRWLFEHSRAYWYWTLWAGFSPQKVIGDRMHDDVRRNVNAVITEAEAVKSRLVLYFPPRLWAPFVKSPAEASWWHADVIQLTEQHGFRAVWLADYLLGKDNAAYNLDGVHFNAKGHSALAPIFEQIVVEELGLKAAPGDGAASRPSAALDSRLPAR